MAETDEAPRPGRPSNAEKFAHYEEVLVEHANTIRSWVAVVQRLEQELETLGARVLDLEEKVAAQPALFTPNADQLEMAASEYCEGCGSRIGTGHFEGPDGQPCRFADVSEPAPAETAA